MDDKVSVRWWNHRQALYKAIRALQNRETFADVILICETKKFEAHKFVLSACSEFFEKQLNDMPYRECFYLPAEIKETQFVSLLDYMYGGEAIVKEEEVNPLLKAAEILCIRGLAVPFYDEDEEDDDETSNGQVEIKTKKSIIAPLSKKRPRPKSSKSGLRSGGGPHTSSSCQFEKIKGSVEAMVADDEDFLGNAVTSFKNENASPDKDGQNVNVNDVLTVLMNGEQNPNNFIDLEPEKGKSWSAKSKDDRAKDPKLVCPHCQRQFHWRSNLTKHIRTHTGEKPYTCSECNYKTGYSEALKRHIRTHTGEKPYECALCDYKCKDGSSLKLHMNKHTGNSSFSCSLCTYKTRIESAFDKHRLTHPELNTRMKEEKDLVESPPPHSLALQSASPPPLLSSSQQRQNHERMEQQQPHIEPQRPHIEPPRPHIEPPRPHIEPPRPHIEPPRPHIEPPHIEHRQHLEQHPNHELQHDHQHHEQRLHEQQRHHEQQQQLEHQQQVASMCYQGFSL